MKQFYELKKISLVIFLGLIVFYLSGCSSSNNVQPSGPTYPISSDVQTTRQRTVVPTPVPSGSPQIYPYQVELYSQYGYGSWNYGPPVDAGKRTEIMGAGYNSASVTNTARLLNFFVITDIHLSDKESPAQRIYYSYKGGAGRSPGAYSATKLYTTQVLDAAIQTVNALHKRDAFDFGLSLGDDCDNTQYNELRWFMDVIDGKLINPSSGNHAGAGFIDYQKSYQAAGLDKTISWYQAIGNHDHFWGGNFPVNDYVRAIYTGLNILNLGYPLTSLDGRGYYMGAIDGRTPYGDIMGVGPDTDFTSPPQVLAADQNRRSLTRNEWINEFFNTSSSPVGHGFSQSNVQTGFACYSFKPKASVPIKIIVLDDTQREDNPNLGLPYAFGYLDQERYTWLIEELDKGQAAGELMIVAAHVPIGVNTAPSGSNMSIWSTISPISQDTLITKLHTYPNLLMWIAGHRHCNVVTPFQSPDSSHPELGFWGVETSSLVEYPQQFRTFDVALNSDNTISIIITNVDPAVTIGSLAATSRSYGIASFELFDVAIGNLPTGSYNAELLKQLSPDMQLKIKNFGTPINKKHRN